MPPRVTEEEVREIIETSLTDIDVFIATANLMVTAHLGTSSLSDGMLKEIEKYIAAHILSVRDPRVKSTKVDVLGETYTGEFKMHLNSTAYGQTAIMLDTTGILWKLANSGASYTASLKVLGYN